MLLKIKIFIKRSLESLADVLNSSLPASRVISLGESGGNFLFRFVRKYKKFGGKERLRRLTFFYEKNETINLDLDINDFTQYYYYANLFEDDDFALLRILKKYPNGVFLDVGANIGFYSLIASKYFKETFSFEPFVLTRSRLEKNIKLNNAENIRVQPFALSDKNGEAYINPTPHNLGNNFVSDHFKEDSVLIKTKTLDGFAIDSEISKIDLIKIDVEGHECSVLRGSIASIVKFLPDIYIECKSSQTYQEFIGLLPDNYKGFNPVNGEAVSSEGPWLMTDVFFTTKGRLL